MGDGNVKKSRFDPLLNIILLMDIWVQAVKYLAPGQSDLFPPRLVGMVRLMQPIGTEKCPARMASAWMRATRCARNDVRTAFIAEGIVEDNAVA